MIRHFAYTKEAACINQTRPNTASKIFALTLGQFKSQYGGIFYCFISSHNLSMIEKSQCNVEDSQTYSAY